MQGAAACRPLASRANGLSPWGISGGCQTLRAGVAYPDRMPQLAQSRQHVAAVPRSMATRQHGEKAQCKQDLARLHCISYEGESMQPASVPLFHLSCHATCQWLAAPQGLLCWEVSSHALGLGRDGCVECCDCDAYPNRPSLHTDPLPKLTQQP